MSRPEDLCKKIHALLRRLPTYTDPRSVPFYNGLYFFYEDGESSEHGPPPDGRIVRIGNHPRAQEGLIPRLKQHYGSSKNSSIFRKYLGGSLIRRKDPNSPCLLPSPGQGHWEKANERTCPRCRPYEKKVTVYIRENMRFRCIRILDIDERNQCENKLIATVSSCKVCIASDDWLGLLTYSSKVKASGMWNHSHVHASRYLMDNDDLVAFETVIDNTLSSKDEKGYLSRPKYRARGGSIIPRSIRREDIIKAIEEIKKGGVPNNRKSKHYCIDYEGGHYPPKYFISLASGYATGHDLLPDEFNGGDMTNSFLASKGFKVIKCGLRCRGTRH